MDGINFFGQITEKKEIFRLRRGTSKHQQCKPILWIETREQERETWTTLFMHRVKLVRSGH